MTDHSHDRPIHRRADHRWVLGAWVVPLTVAAGITIVTAGFGVITIVVAIMIGLVATALHHWGPAK